LAEPKPYFHDLRDCKIEKIVIISIQTSKKNPETDRWRGPCLQEIPNLKTLYDKTDKSKFEIIGIVGDSPI
tara:strand:- start:2505 stop:2717 length:213 start_codon:yes stop_codon:yes gene_type:complete